MSDGKIIKKATYFVLRDHDDVKMIGDPRPWGVDRVKKFES